MDYKYEENKIYAVDEKGAVMTQADFSPAGKGVLDITHVYTNPVLRGQGAAGLLMEAVVDYLRDKGYKAVASCSYANSWLQKNSGNCSDVIAAGNEDLPYACKIDGKH